MAPGREPRETQPEGCSPSSRINRSPGSSGGGPALHGAEKGGWGWGREDGAGEEEKCWEDVCELRLMEIYLKRLHRFTGVGLVASWQQDGGREREGCKGG